MNQEVDIICFFGNGPGGGGTDGNGGCTNTLAAVVVEIWVAEMVVDLVFIVIRYRI